MCRKVGKTSFGANLHFSFSILYIIHSKLGPLLEWLEDALVGAKTLKLFLELVIYFEEPTRKETEVTFPQRSVTFPRLSTQKTTLWANYNIIPQKAQQFARSPYIAAANKCSDDFRLVELRNNLVFPYAPKNFTEDAQLQSQGF